MSAHCNGCGQPGLRFVTHICPPPELSNLPTMCPHARPHWSMCPHCLGVSSAFPRSAAVPESSEQA